MVMFLSKIPFFKICQIFSKFGQIIQFHFKQNLYTIVIQYNQKFNQHQHQQKAIQFILQDNQIELHKTQQESCSPKHFLKFAQNVEKLKFVKRTGWTLFKQITNVQSVADHSYRLAMMVLGLNNIYFDRNKALIYCLLHDLAESISGDIIPSQNIDKQTKFKMQYEAMKIILQPLTRSRKEQLFRLWIQYEKMQNIEALIVKDLDILQMMMQGISYEKEYKTQLQEFIVPNLDRLRTQEIRKYGKYLIDEKLKQ